MKYTETFWSISCSSLARLTNLLTYLDNSIVKLARNPYLRSMVELVPHCQSASQKNKHSYQLVRFDWDHGQNEIDL
jgi:hypothetical protein